MELTRRVMPDVKPHLFPVIDGQDTAVIGDPQSAAWIVQESGSAYAAQCRGFNCREKQPLSIL